MNLGGIAGSYAPTQIVPTAPRLPFGNFGSILAQMDRARLWHSWALIYARDFARQPPLKNTKQPIALWRPMVVTGLSLIFLSPWFALFSTVECKYSCPRSTFLRGALHATKRHAGDNHFRASPLADCIDCISVQIPSSSSSSSSKSSSSSASSSSSSSSGSAEESYGDATHKYHLNGFGLVYTAYLVAHLCRLASGSLSKHNPLFLDALEGYACSRF